ncbi:hypothetical protein TSOC_007216, partial [Tetrabaena socialis]
MPAPRACLPPHRRSQARGCSATPAAAQPQVLRRGALTPRRVGSLEQRASSAAASERVLIRPCLELELRGLRGRFAHRPFDVGSGAARMHPSTAIGCCTLAYKASSEHDPFGKDRVRGGEPGPGARRTSRSGTADRPTVESTRAPTPP